MRSLLPLRRPHGRVARFTLVALAGAVAALLAVGLAGSVSGTVGPGRVELRAVAGRGETVVEVPPLGQARAHTHAAPLRLEARVERVDLTGRRGLLGEDGPRDVPAVRRDVLVDLGPLVRRLVLRALVVAAVAGAMAGLLVGRRHWSRAVLGAVGGITCIAVLGTATWVAYRPGAFDDARFSGPLAQAPALLDSFEQRVGRFDVVRGRLANLARHVDALYQTTAGSDAKGEVRLLHVSDLHSNPVAVELVTQLAEQFDVDAVVDTGDVTSFGYPLEANVGALIAGVKVPWILTPGNHDATPVRQALAQVPNVRVLDSSSVTVRGLRIYGVADPTFTADSKVTAKEAAAVKESVRPAVLAGVRRARPDIYAVHDPILARGAAGLADVVLTGHTHKRSFRTDHGTVFAGVGSTGAGGVGAYLTEGTPAYEAEVLRFRGGRLAALDYLRLDGTDGSFHVDRHVFRTDRELAAQ